MNNYFRSSLINELTVTVFVLCLYLLQVQAQNDIVWDAVIRDLTEIETTFGKSLSQVDAFLYTAENFIDACKLSAMRCFSLEMKVIWYESSLGDDKSFAKHVSNVLQNIDVGLNRSSTQDKETPTCRQCETFEEKNVTQFIEGLKNAVQRFHRHSRKWQS